MKEISNSQKNMLYDYLAGFLTEEQNKEFEAELFNNEDVRTQKENLEKSLESYASVFKKKPNSDLSSFIWDKIKDDKLEIENNTKGVEKSFFSNRILRIAASLVFLLSLIGNIYLSNEARTQKEHFLSVIEEKKQLKDQLLTLKNESDLVFNEVKLLKDPTIKLCKLLSSNSEINSSVLLGIDMKHDMQVLVLSPNLPQKDSDHSYQLWAVSSSGVKTCLGTFDSENQIYKMKKLPYVPKEFGVTIEKGKTGQPQPTSEFLVRGI